jgi:glycosyltransferase involved in cell wall biosynthesis
MLSVVVITKNEEKNILDCLDSISWADEIVIIDDESEDRTKEIVENLDYSKKVKVYTNSLNDDFSSQRNYGLSKATNEWVLFLDADERVTKEFREEINDILISEKNNKNINGFYIPRKDILWGKLLKHGEVSNIKLLRLARKNSGIWTGKVHEEWNIEGKTGETDSGLIHYPHQTINEFLREINFYTTLRAAELFEKKVRVSFLGIILYTKGKFFKNYIIKRGFLDGIEGIIHAFLMSFHSFLVRGKLWLLWKKS